VNTVRYDPARLTVADMVRALKASGTYLGVVE
jgi:hypothetical protein